MMNIFRKLFNSVRWVILILSSLTLLACDEKLKGALDDSQTTAPEIPASPEITSVLPSYISRVGGETLVLTGTGFLTESTVSIADLSCQSLVVNSETEAECVTPTGLPLGSVIIKSKNPNVDENQFALTVDIKGDYTASGFGSSNSGYETYFKSILNGSTAITMAIYNDKIYVAGTYYNIGPQGIKLWRYNLDGTPDLTFGSGGVNYTEYASGSSTVAEMKVSSNGIFLVGRHTTNYGAVWKFNLDGSSDNTFAGGPDNQLLLSDGASSRLVSIELTDNYIFAVGSEFLSGPGEDEQTIYRFDLDGTGEIKVGEDGYGRSASVVVAGSSVMSLGYDSSTNEPYTNRFDLSLNPDNFYGVGGSDNHYGITGISDIPKKLALINGVPIFNSDSRLYKLQADGTEDFDFGSDPGKNYIEISDFGGGVINDILIDDSKIYLVGQLSGDYKIWKFKSDGLPDNEFGADGVNHQVFSDIDGLGDGTEILNTIKSVDGRVFSAGDFQSGADHKINIFEFW